jgi:hypothetical protein
MGVSALGGTLATHPFIDPRQLQVSPPAVGASAGTAFPKVSTQTAGTAFVRPDAVPPPKDLGRVVDVKL